MDKGATSQRHIANELFSIPKYSLTRIYPLNDDAIFNYDLACHNDIRYSGRWLIGISISRIGLYLHRIEDNNIGIRTQLNAALFVKAR